MGRSGGMWKKAEAALVERFDAALPGHPPAERRTMFGYPACFVNGHYVAGLHQDTFVIRLPLEVLGPVREAFPEVADAPWFGPMSRGKPMRDWYEVPSSIVLDDERLAALLRAAVDAVASLPPKASKPRRTRLSPGGS
jgi:hypothetical protein